MLTSHFNRQLVHPLPANATAKKVSASVVGVTTSETVAGYVVNYDF